MKRTNEQTVAIVDNDANARLIIRNLLKDAGYEVLEFSQGEQILAEVPFVDLVCLALEDTEDIEILKQIKRQNAEPPILVLLDEHNTSSATSAVKAGAYDYVVKPRDYQRLPQAIERAIERQELATKIKNLTNELEERRVMRAMIGKSPQIQALTQQVERMLHSDVPVVIFGEPGTGKEMIARSIHYSGRRKGGPFVTINCAATPENLLETELFGYEKGAFTGANKLYRGRFEQANGGTLFLDELGEMSPSTQASLLRTLKEKTIRRIGSTNMLPVNVRVISSTRHELNADVEKGKLRKDLYLRLVVHPLRIPALRERTGDIPLLIGHFLKKLSAEGGRPTERVSPDALEALCHYQWPGNVRELENVLHQAMLCCDSKELTLEQLPQELRAPRAPKAIAVSKTEAVKRPIVPLRELERQAILDALQQTRGKIGVAAQHLGIGRATLYRKLAEYGINGELGEQV